MGTYAEKVLTIIRASVVPIRMRDIVNQIDARDMTTFNGVGMELTHLYRAGLVDRERIGSHYYYAPPSATPNGCPFCGGAGEMRHDASLYWMRCRRCGAQAGAADTDPGARLLWNRRAAG